MTLTFHDIWSTRHFHYPFRDKKDVLKAAQSLFSTMRYDFSIAAEDNEWPA